ncbi:hypothetical protein NGUA15_03304 [Salmonella enterica]|nr:hypothetical protein NGUA15_03304 [Salmonella enterica]
MVWILYSDVYPPRFGNVIVKGKKVLASAANHFSGKHNCGHAWNGVVSKEAFQVKRFFFFELVACMFHELRKVVHLISQGFNPL